MAELAKLVFVNSTLPGCLSVVWLVGFGAHTLSGGQADVTVPKIWDDAKLAVMTLPPSLPEGKIIYLPSEVYYRLKAPPIYKTYPVYHPDYEPEGYLGWLQRQAPQVVFDSKNLKSESDWVRAGEIVFQQPTEFLPTDSVRDRAWWAAVQPPLTMAGIMPAYSYVVRKKGVVELGTGACANCHGRVLTNGVYLLGAQGNFPVERAYAERLRRTERQVWPNRLAQGLLLPPEEIERWTEGLYSRSKEEIISAYAAMPLGVAMRPGFSYLDPPKIADLIGVRDRRYLDLTARLRQQSVEDIARYGSMCPSSNYFFTRGNSVPKEIVMAVSGSERYSDEQALAFAKYVYSLRPPVNPNKSSEITEQGRQIFEREGCPVCHTPPLYTNNKLVPAGRVTSAPLDRTKDSILSLPVGVDERAGLISLRARGYYKIPSLKGVWYRGPFTHNGSIATLEDWFDPARLRDDYVPSGYKPSSLAKRAIPGHPFGLFLPSKDRMALVAFLKTL